MVDMQMRAQHGVDRIPSETNRFEIREEGQVMRPVYIVQVKAPGESKGKTDMYKIEGEIPPDQIFRPLAEGGCDFVKK